MSCSRGIRRSWLPGMRYPRSWPVSNHFETVRGATRQIRATNKSIPIIALTAHAMASDAEKAREFTQDAFIRAFSRLSQFRGEAAFSTWLHRIVVTVVSNARRNEVRFGREVALDEAHSIESTSTEAEPDLKESIARAVNALSEAYRTTLILHDVEGYTHAEIAVMLGVPEGTCKSRLSVARAQLREALAAFKE